MLKALSLSAILFGTATAVSAQADVSLSRPTTDSIRLHKSGGGYQFYHRGARPLKMNQLVQVLQPNEQAFKVFKASRAPRTVATILGYSGGFLVGYPLGTAIAGGDPNWIMAGIGAGLVAIALPLEVSANKKLMKAVRIYNADLQTPNSASRLPQLRFQVGGNGVGLALNF